MVSGGQVSHSLCHTHENTHENTGEAPSGPGTVTYSVLPESVKTPTPRGAADTPLKDVTPG